MKISQLKEQIRGIIRERSVKAIQKEYSNVVDDIQKHLELYKKSKGTPEEKKHVGHLKTLGEKKKKLQAELDLAVAGLYKNAELKVDEAITNPKKTNPSDLAKTVLGWFDFYTDYIDDGGQRRRAIKSNDDVLVWFGSHPKDVKEKAYKIMVSQAKSEKGQVERTFGKHLNESVIDLNKTKFESVNESKLTVSQLPFKLLFNYPSGHTSTPGNFEDWYRDGMELKKGRIERFSPEDDKKLRSLINTWWDEVDDTSIEDFNFGRDNKYIKKVKKDILDFLIQKSKVIKESVNEGLYHVGYNKGRGQGTGVFKDSYSSYKDAKKAVEKLEKERGGSYNTIAYYVSDKDGKIVKESVNESENFNGYVSSSDGKTFTLYNSDKKKIKDVSFDDLKNKYMKTYLGQKLKDFKDSFDKTTSKGKYFQWWKGKLVNVKLSNIDESINEATEPEVISQLRDIVKNQQYQSVKDPSSGKKMKVDMQTANIVLKIYDGLSNVNKQTMVKMGLPKMIDVSNKIISKYR
jgi:hypothetical protein